MSENKQTVLTGDQNAIIAAKFPDDPANAVRAQSAVVEILSKLRGAGEPVAWRYQTATGWHATTDAGKALAVKEHHPIEALYAAPQASAEGDIQEKLKDPNVVHVNMLRGTIAPITFDQLAHVLGDEATAKWIADRQQRGGDVKHIADDTRVGILADSSYINGLRHGYMLGQEGNEAEYQQILGATRQQVIEARAALAATKGESNG